MSTQTLFVPINVQAMVVNEEARKGRNFQRWKMDYSVLNSHGSPSPNTFSGNTALDWNDNPDANGVYLHWTLPDALKTGVQQSTGALQYPLVPNRWLIVRYSGEIDKRIATAWIVESDFLDNNEGTSTYIDPDSKDQVDVTLIGRKVDLSSWSEQASKDLFLTTVGTGDLTFSAYQPYNENVFSIHDPLDDIATDTLSYMVAGWYSDSTKDLLSSVTDPATFLEIIDQLNWEVEGADDVVASVSVYHGMCYGIEWDKFGPVLESKPETASIAVGNTAIDAMAAYIEHQAAGDESIDTELLEAFQYNLLPLMDQPNGPDLLYQAIHQAWYGKKKGGYEFVIARENASGNNSSNIIPAAYLDKADPNLEPDWLFTLNQDQLNYDEAYRVLQSLQWNLYRMWWTKGKFDNIGGAKQLRLKEHDGDFSDEVFEQQLDPEYPGSLAQQVQQQALLVTGLYAKLPKGASKDELRQSILDYASNNNIAEGYVLKRTEKAPFFLANDPAVLISGAKASEPLVSDEALTCRLKEQLISGLSFDDKTVDVSMMNGTIPMVDLANVPNVPAELLEEFFFLDATDATMIAAIALEDKSDETISSLSAQMEAHEDMTGTLPDMDLSSWKQPWSPMYLLWTVEYYPIAHDKDGKDNWRFDGARYLLNEQLEEEDELPSHVILSGTSLLTPQTGFSFKRKLDDYRQKHPGLDDQALTNIEDFISDTDDWDLLSQTLDGFMGQLTSRHNAFNVVPVGNDPTLPLIGGIHSPAPILGPIPEPMGGWPTTDFQPYRSGQFCFRELMLVDRFGQSLQLTTSQTYLELKPVVSPDMRPEQTVLQEEPYRFIQVPPRLLQPARLNFDFIASTDDSQLINLNSGVNPVCAWILPNHLDRALACYDPAGLYLGELTVITNDQDQKEVVWQPGEGTEFTTVELITNSFPHLGQMLAAIIAKGGDAFNNFYQVIDETLWVVDPLGSRDDQNLSVLIGRPLALTRCRLKYELHGPAVTDPSWQYTFKQAPAAFTEYHFPVRLGELKLRNDGLIGYFEGSNYDQFNSVHIPEGTLVPLSPPYNQKIQEGNFIDLTFQEDSEVYLTLLMDPRASVHATTSILPSKLLDIPTKFVDSALGNMAINIKVGPVLAGLTAVIDDQNNTSETMLIPQPAENNGTWTWKELEGTSWTDYPIQSPDDSVTLSNSNPELRTGTLRLTQDGND